MDQPTKKTIIEHIQSILLYNPNIIFAYVFGSFSREESFRDIDIAVYTAGGPSFNIESTLSAQLQDALGYDVEVKIINDAPTKFQMGVLREGLLLFSKDENLRTEFLESVSRRLRENDQTRSVYLDREDEKVMTLLNRERLEQNRADILAAKENIGQLVSIHRDVFLSDEKNIFALKYLLIQVVESITDLCQHILAKKKATACGGYVDCIVKAGIHGIIPIPLSNKLRKLADLRNNLIHRYWIIEPGELYSTTKENIVNLVEFVHHIDSTLADPL